MAETNEPVKIAKTSAPETNEPVKMAETSAPLRMQKSYPNEFTPKAIFFLTPTTSRNIKDWNDCFNIKASSVYFAIFDQYPKTLNAAVLLLKVIAKNCDNLIKKKANDASGDIAKVHKTLNEIAETEIEKLSDSMKITIDAVYLEMSFLRDIKKGADANNEREKLDKYCIQRHGAHVLSDIAMLDNQLPLDLLINVVQKLPKAVTNTHSQLKDLLSSKDQLNLNTHSQLKDLLSSTDPKNLNSLENFKLSFTEYNFHEVISLFSWYYSPFYAGKMKFRPPQSDLLGKKTLLECLHHCLVQSGGTNISDKSPSTTPVWPIRTAKELRQAGVRFVSSTDWPVTVKFTPPSLKLPVLFYDSKLETVAMNLLALESSWSTRPITRYYQMMNELVDDVRDVRALKKFGVVRGWRKEDDAVSFVKKVDGFASYPSMCPAIDAVMNEVNKFHDGRMNRFLGRFRPDNSWVPYVAAASVILTAIVVTKRRG